MNFRPSLAATVLLAALAWLFVQLGEWQWERAGEKQALLDAFDQAPVLTGLPKDPPPFARVEVGGEWDTRRHFLLDNQVLEGRPGVHALSLFHAGEGRYLLVNRGWLPMPADRAVLPDVPTPPGHQVLTGHLEALRTPGTRLGEPETFDPSRWPQLVTWPDRSAMGRALGENPYPLTLYLDSESPGGFAGRDWSPVVMGPNKHRAYAVQWFALGATAVVAWFVLALKRKSP